MGFIPGTESPMQLFQQDGYFPSNDRPNFNDRISHSQSSSDYFDAFRIILLGSPQLRFQTGQSYQHDYAEGVGSSWLHL